MDQKKRAAVLSFVLAIPAYFMLARDPFLPPAVCYSVAAGAGFIAGTGINILWTLFSQRKGNKP